MNFLNRKTVEDIDVAGKRVLVRCDYNVPFDSEGNITDTKRIDESIKTLRYLIDHNAKVIICSHRGRPKGTVKPELSLAPTIPYLSKVLGQQVQMATDVVGESAKSLCANLQEGQVMMLENVRFEKGEEANDPAFAKELAELLDFYHIAIITPQEHDKMIGFVSQLTHAVAVSLMNTSDNTHLKEYTGDSFRDLTRIAKINETLWSELFFLNKKNLVQEIDDFVAELENLKQKIADEDEEGIKKLFIQSTERRKQFDK